MIIEHKSIKIDCDETSGCCIQFEGGVEIYTTETMFKAIRNLTQHAFDAAQDKPENLEGYLADVRDFTGKYLYDDEQCRLLVGKLAREFLKFNNSLDYIMGPSL